MKRCALLLLAGCGTVDGVVLELRAPADASIVEEAGDAPEALRDAADDAAGELDAAEEDAGTDAEAPAIDTRGVCRIAGASEGFYDSFSGTSLDARWLVADGTISFGGEAHTFTRDAVAVSGGALRLTLHGDLSATPHLGAAVATRDSFASGTYQVQGVFAVPEGVHFALWYVRDDDSAGAIELGAPSGDSGALRYDVVRMRTRDASSVSENAFPVSESLADGASHILRFDLYNTSRRAVSFWVDDTQRWESTASLPTPDAGRLWIVAYLPEGAPADFETIELRIDNAFITPFGNDGDRCLEGELSGPGLGIAP